MHLEPEGPGSGLTQVSKQAYLASLEPGRRACEQPISPLSSSLAVRWDGLGLLNSGLSLAAYGPPQLNDEKQYANANLKKHMSNTTSIPKYKYLLTSANHI